MSEKRYGLAKLSPSIRLVFFVVFSLASTVVNTWTWVLFFFAVGTFLLIAGRKYSKPAMLAITNVFVLTFAGNALFAQEDVLFSFFLFSVSQESIFLGLLLGLRIVGMMLIAIAYAAATPRHEILPALRGLRLPGLATMYMMILVRYVDILWYELQVSMKAMRIRGVDLTSSPLRRIAVFRQLLIPIFYRMLEHIEGQALAIDARGGVKATKVLNVFVSEQVAAVEMKDVEVRYSLEHPGSIALERINLLIGQGEQVVILGPTGAGKSTILLLCTGLIPQSTAHMVGKVRLFGQDSKRTPLDHLTQLARIVFPSAVQGLVGLTVRDELELSLRRTLLKQGEYEQAMTEALHAVGLNMSFLDRLTLGISGGEMQRVALASAVIGQPKLLVLDDVNVQLDSQGRQDVVKALMTIRGKNLTTVFTDSNVELIRELADEYISLEDGQVTHSGPVKSLKTNVLQRGHLRTKKYIRRVYNSENHVSDNVVLEAENLSYSYDRVVALQGVSVQFRSSEFVALLGANGSGKTTLGLILAKAIEPSSGKLMGSPVPGEVGYVFQEPMNQILTMSVADELAFGPRQLGMLEDNIERSVKRELQRFGLSGDSKPLELPHSKLRQLAIASVLTMNPRVLILDEPTNDFDEVETLRLMAILESLCKEGVTIVFITHDLELAYAYADRVLIMEDGRIVDEKQQGDKLVGGKSYDES